MTNEYPPAYILRIKAIDTISFLIGLVMLAIPAVHRFFPGDIDTTVHVALGCLIAVCAIFRVLVAWGSAWLEIVLFFLGLLVFLLPTFMHMRYEPHYHTVHMIAGAVLMAVSVISALMTFAQLRTNRPY